jgi:hypothetical protein
MQDPVTKTVAVTMEENLKVIEKYCNSLYNRDDVTVDYEVLNDIRQRPVESELGMTPHKEEIYQAI